VRRELVLLLILGAMVVAGFLLTRAAAAATHTQRLRDAATWYDDGQRALAAGRTEPAVAALRRAVALDRHRTQYLFALADALLANAQDEPARQLLLAIRASQPEDPDVNLRLARVEARRQDLSAAVRYYQNALYGVWGDEPDTARRRVRFELIRYLVAHGQRARAVSELLVLGSGLPTDHAADHVETGRLFLAGGEPQQALEYFRRALRLDPGNASVLSSAGEAAFALGQYAVAQRYFRQAAPTGGRAAELQVITSLVLASDPLRSGLTVAERHARAIRALAHVTERLTTCVDAQAGTGAPSGGEVEALQSEARRLEPALAPRQLRRDPDAIDAAVELIDRIEQRTSAGCGPVAPLDRALLLIHRRTDTEQP
jgi:tetratricopeptide (TPR) repeat protein